MSDAMSEAAMANDVAIDDMLGAAIAALRDGALVGADDGEHTRRRVMASMGERARGRKWRVGFAVLAFALSTATLSWAASTGKLDGVMEAVGIGAPSQSQGQNPSRNQIQNQNPNPSPSPSPNPIVSPDPTPSPDLKRDPDPVPQPRAKPQQQPRPQPRPRARAHAAFESPSPR